MKKDLLSDVTRSGLLAAALILGPTLATATPPQQAAGADIVTSVRSYRRANEHRILGELLEFLRIPNVAADLANIRVNAAWLMRAMEARGIEAKLRETDGAPYVFGELIVPGARQTLLFYCHYDGQPVDVSLWVGHDPWDPVVRDGRLADGAAIVSLPESGIDPDWRVYARAAADDRSPIIMILAALTVIGTLISDILLAMLDPRIRYSR